MVKFVTPIATISHRFGINKLKVKKFRAKPSTFANGIKSVPKSSWIGRNFKEFATNTALHGYNYIVRDDSTKWERIAWIIVVLIATIVAVVLLCISWQMNLETPTITVIESTHYPIMNVYFPAVTICNMNYVSAKQATILATKMTRPKNITVQKLSQLFQLILHFQGIGENRFDDYDLLHSILQTNNISIVNLTTTLKPKCSDMLKGCRWKGGDIRCENIFQPINTIEGICCSFNYHGTEKSNFPPKISMAYPKEPYLTSSCGYNTGLTIVMTSMTNDYHTSLFSGEGSHILIHDAFDYADDNAERKALNTKMLAYIMIYPETTYSTADVRNLAPNIRNCDFHDEHQLSYFQRYSQLNCLAECRTKIASQLCGCAPYFLPNNGSQRVCEMNDMKCVRANRPAFFGDLSGLHKTILGLNGSIDKNDMDIPCDCLPVCQLNQYPTELTSAALNHTFSAVRMDLYKGINITDHTTVTVFFADLVSTHYRTDIYQNWLSLLASLGGILGLLLGFSFVAGFELIYFFTIRVFFDRFQTNTTNNVYHSK